MVPRHLHVQLAHSTVQAHVPVFLVHVVNSCPGLVPEDNAEGFDVIGSFFVDLVDGKDLALGAFGFELSSKVIPKLGLGDDFISGKEANGINLGIGVLFGGELPAHDEILLDFHL